jgi:hypothetical protein
LADSLDDVDPDKWVKDMVSDFAATHYTTAVADDLEAVGIQLQAKNRDFWDSYDRQIAEARFRNGIVPPIILIILLLAIESGHAWWLLLLIAPAILFYRGLLHSVMATSTLVHAIVLKMVEPPVLERLREVVAKKEEGAKAEADKSLSDALRGARSRPEPIPN